MKKQTYELVRNGDNIGIKCLWCNRTSWNRNDVTNRYCVNCHNFHDDPNDTLIDEGLRKKLNSGSQR